MVQQPESGQQDRDFPWPGVGLVLGAGIGGTVGAWALKGMYPLTTAGGAGLGLVVGAVIEAMRSRRAQPPAGVDR